MQPSHRRSIWNDDGDRHGFALHCGAKNGLSQSRIHSSASKDAPWKELWTGIPKPGIFLKNGPLNGRAAANSLPTGGNKGLDGKPAWGKGGVKKAEEGSSALVLWPSVCYETRTGGGLLLRKPILHTRFCGHEMCVLFSLSGPILSSAQVNKASQWSSQQQQQLNLNI